MHVSEYWWFDDLPMNTLFDESLSPPGLPSFDILDASPTVTLTTLVASAVILDACYTVMNIKEELVTHNKQIKWKEQEKLKERANMRRVRIYHNPNDNQRNNHSDSDSDEKMKYLKVNKNLSVFIRY